MSLSVNELKPKVYFVYEGQPYVVLTAHHLKMQQRRPVVQTRIRSLITGKVVEINFAQSDTFKEADIVKSKVKFLYAHRGEYWFSEEDDPSKRFKLEETILGSGVKFLKPSALLDVLLFEGRVINIELPIKMDFKVVEAPPAIRGNTAQGGTKQVKIETGAHVNAPLFIKEGDIIRINTESGEYVERIGKK